MSKKKTNKKEYLAAPYIVWMIVFTIIPMALVIYFSLTTIDGKFTFDNLKNIGEYTPVFLSSIKLSAISTILCLLLGYPFAYIISKVKMSKQMIFMIFIMLPMWINFLLRTYAWMTLLENNGIINKFLGLFGIAPVHMINTQGAVVLGMVYNFLPYMIIPIFNVITKIDKSVIEAAQDLGANQFHVMTRIIFPLSMPGIVSGITMVFVPAVSTFIISTMLGGGSNMMIGDLIDLQFLGGSYDPNLGSALSLVLMVLILISMGIMNEFDSGDGEVLSV
ncbi:MAG: ABC transporter permease [Clostridia bacterium]|nr:ABC transporter permease [Clostridia bacterium]